MSIMKWTSKRTGDNIDLEFSRPGKQATDYVDRSIQPTLIRQALGKEAQRLWKGIRESHRLCRWAGARFRWFQVFFGLSFRACRIAFLTAHVREGLEAFWKGLPCWCLPQTGVLYWCVSDGTLVNRSVMLGSKADLVKLKTTPLLQPWRTTSLSKWEYICWSVSAMAATRVVKSCFSAWASLSAKQAAHAFVSVPHAKLQDATLFGFQFQASCHFPHLMSILSSYS